MRVSFLEFNRKYIPLEMFQKSALELIAGNGEVIDIRIQERTSGAVVFEFHFAEDKADQDVFFIGVCPSIEELEDQLNLKLSHNTGSSQLVRTHCLSESQRALAIIVVSHTKKKAANEKGNGQKKNKN